MPLLMFPITPCWIQDFSSTDRFQVPRQTARRDRQGSKFKGYNRSNLLKILIKMRNTCH